MGETGLRAGLERLAANARALDACYRNYLNDQIREAAPEGEAYMKEHAPWTDDTGAAREGLHTVVGDLRRNEKTIEFAHSVDYGIWLETKYNGRDEIIMPAVKHTGERLMAGLEDSLNRAD